ncbi:MAG: hypothetical protein A2V90_04245 [Gammaproteobacteria bacterium RBG_16_57_12]|nr:MAG: hypothetical protein A2V90_04245 [Gammaproteobacteria bacterium RBG_16_57_12]
MKINDSLIQFHASHTYVEKHEQHESLTVWRDGSDRVTLTGDNNGKALLPQALTYRNPPAARQNPAPAVEIPAPAESGQDEKQDIDHPPMEDFKLTLLKLMIEQLTGEKIKVVDAKELKKITEQTGPQLDELAQADRNVQTAPPRDGYGLIYEYHESHYEAESTRVSIEGLVRTADGQQIQINVDLSMSREFSTSTQLSIRAGDALKDPLVINFSGSAAELTGTQFNFDIDADGYVDQISFVSPGSGFLALDQNADGIINDGSELFGAGSGDGFAELSRYDSDHNHWIDENDAVFDRLGIWSKTATGEDLLLNLRSNNIGAIYLGSVASPFAVKDGQNGLLGAIRATGLYLTENGATGTIQQLDLVV